MSRLKNNEDIILNARLEELDKEVSIFYSFERNFRHRNKNSKIQNLETYSLKTEALRDYEIIKYIGVSAETRKNPEYLGNMIKKFKKNGYSNIFDLNKLYWERLWKNRKWKSME
jgi:trehalose/maltose hydrolase-like predicted phosphorylase